ncbi:MAG: ferrochelatase [Actinomycetota bacterium]
MSDRAEKVGVLVMAYGTPRTPEEIEPYYTDIRRGRPPTPELLEELVGRYAAIGGVSPLAQLTEAQRDAIQSTLDEIEPGRFVTGLGLKHADPKVEAGAAALVADGCDQVVGVVLAPHESSYSIGQYLDRAQSGIDETRAEVPMAGIRSWAVEPAFIDFLTTEVEQRRARMRLDLDAAGRSGAIRVVFTAHSMPTRIVEGGDPYAGELRSTAEAVAERLDLTEGVDWQIGWQSAGRTPEPWIGPDILEVVDELGADPGVDGVIVSSCGFVADHLEVLYDLDIETRQRADEVGLAFDRTASVDADPVVMGALARRVAALAD